MTNKSLLASKPMQLIMGAMSHWTSPPRPCTCVQGQKNCASAVKNDSWNPSQREKGRRPPCQWDAKRHDRDVDDRIESCNSNPSRQSEHCLDHETCQCTTKAFQLVKELHLWNHHGLPPTRARELVQELHLWRLQGLVHEPLSFWTIPTMMPKILDLPKIKGNTA